VERRQEVFYCDGKPLSVAAIERIAHECEYIDEAAAFFTGVGQTVRRVIIAVVLRKDAPGHEPEIAARVAREVPTGACEVVVKALPCLPRLPSGKIDRRTLREHFGAEKFLQGALQ
jgi:acyl-CoA synthetase (AMP-forming)/AMP-acid ligase II